MTVLYQNTGSKAKGGCKPHRLRGLRGARKQEVGAMLAMLGKVDALKVSSE
jgi:hypothetical protein